MQEIRGKTEGKTEAVPGKVTFTGEGASLEANKDLVRRYEEAFIAGRVDDFDQFISADYAEHGYMPGQKAGLEGLKEMVREMGKSFSDPAYVEQDLLAEGDRVVERWCVRMKHTGQDDLFGAPTGKEIEFKGIDIFRIRDGKIVEHWSEMNMLEPLQKLGISKLPQAGKT